MKTAYMVQTYDRIFQEKKPNSVSYSCYSIEEAVTKSKNYIEFINTYFDSNEILEIDDEDMYIYKPRNGEGNLVIIPYNCVRIWYYIYDEVNEEYSKNSYHLTTLTPQKFNEADARDTLLMNTKDNLAARMLNYRDSHELHEDFVETDSHTEDDFATPILGAEDMIDML